MLDKNHTKDGVKVLHVLESLESLLFQAKPKKKRRKNGSKAKSSKSREEIKNRVLLKMERAEIMAAMLAMRQI